jgi:hypothetical protein
MQAGSNPGILNAVDQVGVYGAILANFSGLRQMTDGVREQFGSDLPLSVRAEVYGIIVNELDEKNYGGKWFPAADGPPEHLVDLGAYSPVFQRRRGRLWRRCTEVFCLPAPYFYLLSELFERRTAIEEAQ